MGIYLTTVEAAGSRAVLRSTVVGSLFTPGIRPGSATHPADRAVSRNVYAAGTQPRAAASAARMLVDYSTTARPGHRVD